MTTILVVEDDKLLNQGISYALKGEGYNVLSAYNNKEAEGFVGPELDLIILDINLPDGNGLELCGAIRKTFSVAIIFLTAKDTEDDIIRGFKAGGDDYISKPFSLAILKERIKAVLKRGKNKDHLYVFKNLVFDFKQLSLMKNNQEIPLTKTQISLLELFIRNKGIVLTRGQILEQIWDIKGDFVDENTVSVNIGRLRSKIEDDPSNPVFIKTIFGIGYLWGG